jgi:hypothetical protein
MIPLSDGSPTAVIWIADPVRVGVGTWIELAVRIQTHQAFATIGTYPVCRVLAEIADEDKVHITEDTLR